MCAAIEVVREWRNWLERRGITQPFAQARRDVFLPNEEEVLGAASTGLPATRSRMRDVELFVRKARGGQWPLPLSAS